MADIIVKIYQRPLGALRDIEVATQSNLRTHPATTGSILKKMRLLSIRLTKLREFSDKSRSRSHTYCTTLRCPVCQMRFPQLYSAD